MRCQAIARGNLKSPGHSGISTARGPHSDLPNVHTWCLSGLTPTDQLATAAGVLSLPLVPRCVPHSFLQASRRASRLEWKVMPVTSYHHPGPLAFLRQVPFRVGSTPGHGSFLPASDRFPESPLLGTSYSSLIHSESTEIRLSSDVSHHCLR